ncbi:MAG: DUF72 domain-containing protein [Actinomycetia bacterium]|nr:DUF72 domain-containing protein [Actinomycetes bacterium]
MRRERRTVSVEALYAALPLGITHAGAAMTARVKIGTCGWSYDHWRGVFYPPQVRTSERLAYYATRFECVEIDSTFYGLPREQTLSRWPDSVGEDFSFAAKGSRSITHTRALKGTRDLVATFMDRLGGLGSALKVVLWQLPPSLPCDIALLDRFLSELPAAPPHHAVEFRDPSWLVPATFEVLRTHGATHVNVSSDLMPPDLTVTSKVVYVRFHGTARFDGAYPAAALEPWARFIAEQYRAGRECYAFFNNDFAGHAPRDAMRLAEMLAARGVR